MISCLQFKLPKPGLQDFAHNPGLQVKQKGLLKPKVVEGTPHTPSQLEDIYRGKKIKKSTCWGVLPGRVSPAKSVKAHIFVLNFCLLTVTRLVKLGYRG